MAAISGVCSAGLASAGLPATSTAAISALCAASSASTGWTWPTRSAWSAGRAMCGGGAPGMGLIPGTIQAKEVPPLAGKRLVLEYL